MLTGSTSGLKSLPVLSSQLPCRLFQNPALSTRGHFAALARTRIHSTSRNTQSVLAERNRPGSHDIFATNRCPGSSAHLLPPRPAVSLNGTPCAGIPVLPVDKNNANHLVGIDSPSDTQGRQQHGRASSTQRPHRVVNYTKRKCPAQKRRTLLWVMLTAKTLDRAWAAYEELLSYQGPIPYHLLHKLARLLASIRPRTRTVHLQLLSVLKSLKRNHGQIRLWEWNMLIDSAGKQWHKTRLEDYENSLDIFNKRGVLLAENIASADEMVNAEANPSQQNADIWTYNILLSIASRSNLPLAVRHASSLLLASGLTPNRYTHLCLLRYFATQNDLRSVRSTLRKMTQQGLEVGLDGINACLWAFARNGRFDVALRVYRILRNNVEPKPDLGEHDIEEDFRYIRDTVGLDIPDGLEPDEITYTMMIQALAYHGDLRNALSVFVDMLSTPNRNGATRTDDSPTCYKPSMAAFRGLFLGFARHGRDPEHRKVDTESFAALFQSPRATWNQETLETVLAAFLQLPDSPKPTDSVIYWILVGFDRTSGKDSAKLREVYTKLETKYGGDWGGRLEEIRRSIFN
ncbi:hypothetical protein EV363DRAFT_512506 [Boletus edulis]|nr:hypothetical protein EV363DRAFT_512506 [Boletus edulis]